MKKVMLVFGTRPEAIKMCPLVLELKERKKFNVLVTVTGQHKEMLEQVLERFQIRPDYDLAIMQPHQTLFDVTRKALSSLHDVFSIEKPDLVLVHGDTTTSFVAALAAFYLHIPVGHVEAGLRTYDIHSPFPEEFNRQATGIIAKYNFAPTEDSRQNLIREGKDPNNIYVTGNTSIDALKQMINPEFHHEYLDWIEDNRLILLTAHRRENLGQPLVNIFKAIVRITEQVKDIKVLYPIHLNPLIRQTANEILKDNDRIKLVEPLDVLNFHNFIARSHLILTDSGGIQEEAPALGKPVLVLRDTTERPEGVLAGTLKVIGTNEDDIVDACVELLNDNDLYRNMSTAKNPYGDGTASKQIADILEIDLMKSTK